MDKPIQYSQKQLLQYGMCPQVNFKGGHIAGLNSCVYCAQIFRRYRMLQGNIPHKKNQPEEQTFQEEQEEQNYTSSASKFLQKKMQDDQCGKLMCMKAGWCMCD